MQFAVAYAMKQTHYIRWSRHSIPSILNSSSTSELAGTLRVVVYNGDIDGQVPSQVRP
eukprot:COSAG06_NODE_63434_length_262_cov_0.638037_1_plen_57_part_01